MDKKLSELISTEIWRSGFIEDKNKIRQQAREAMRRLVAYNIATGLKYHYPELDKEQFIKDCKLTGEV